MSLTFIKSYKWGSLLKGSYRETNRSQNWKPRGRKSSQNNLFCRERAYKISVSPSNERQMIDGGGSGKVRFLSILENKIEDEILFYISNFKRKLLGKQTNNNKIKIKKQGCWHLEVNYLEQACESFLPRAVLFLEIILLISIRSIIFFFRATCIHSLDFLGFYVLCALGQNVS